VSFVERLKASKEPNLTECLLLAVDALQKIHNEGNHRAVSKDAIDRIEALLR
jgi:hypothetical protein